MEMLLEIIEKYFKDIEGKPVWEWLGIAQSSWSTMKKNGLTDKTTIKLQVFFNVEELNSKQLAEDLIKKYYKK